jgi:hypothetical protein
LNRHYAFKWVSFRSAATALSINDNPGHARFPSKPDQQHLEQGPQMPGLKETVAVAVNASQRVISNSSVYTGTGGQLARNTQQARSLVRFAPRDAVTLISKWLYANNHELF